MNYTKKDLDIIKGFDDLLKNQTEQAQSRVLSFGDFYKERKGLIEVDAYFACLHKALGFPHENSALFPAFRFKRTQGRVICLNLFPKLQPLKEHFLGKTFFIDLEHHQLVKIQGMKTSETKTEQIELRENKITFDYQIIEFEVEELPTPEDGKKTVMFLIHNRDINYLIYEMVKSLHYKLGFEPKHFDNLGLFWQNHYGDLKTAFVKSL